MAAERGAHLTVTAAAADRPSLFELVAQDSLMKALRPALLHAAQVLASRQPAHCGLLVRGFDEIFVLVELLLQHHFLSRTSASFSENFYGLRRVCSRGAREELGFRRHWRSLLLLALVPYLQRKLERLLWRQRDEDDFSIRAPPSPAQKLWRASVAAYPVLCAAWHGCVFVQQLAYALGKTRTHSPLLWLAGVELRHLTPHDLKLPGAQSQPDQRCRGLVSAALSSVAASLSAGLSVAVFFLQFLEWWYSVAEDPSGVTSLTSVPSFPPPLHLREEETSAPSRMCPLCGAVRRNHTALATSGYVFCYTCIYVFVKARQRCPLTGQRSGLQHLVKIYTPDA